MRAPSMSKADTVKSKFMRQKKEKKVATENPDRAVAVVSNAVRQVISQKNVLKLIEMAEEAVASVTTINV